MKKVLKNFINVIKISLLLTLVFVVVFKQYTIKGIMITFVISCMYSFLLGFGQGIINNYLSTKFDWVTQTNKRLWSGIICTILYTIPTVLVANYMFLVKFQGLDVALFFKGQYFWTHLFYMLLSFFISALLHARSFMLEWKKASQQEYKEQKIVAKNESAKFETLKNQIDPHFLFNSLNVLTSLIGENPIQAERFTTKLSKVYRYVLEQRNKSLVSLSEELNFAKTYIDLLQMRFENAIQYTVAEDLKNLDLNIVPLSLQLLLENAVKHNVVSEKHPLKINLYQKEGNLYIENNKKPKQTLEQKSTKVGLQNISDRYGLLTKRNMCISDNDSKFTVSIPLLKDSDIMNTKKEFKDKNYELAIDHVDKLKEFYGNISSYVFVMIILIIVNLKYTPNNLWFWYPLFGWGMGIVFHWLSIMKFSFVNKNWTTQKVVKVLNGNTDEHAVAKAQLKVQNLKKYYMHLATFFIVSILLFSIQVTSRMNAGENFKQAISHFNNYGIFIIWGIIMVFQTIKMFGFDFIFGKNWEDEKINKYMDKKK